MCKMFRFYLSFQDMMKKHAKLNKVMPDKVRDIVDSITCRQVDQQTDRRLTYKHIIRPTS